MELWMSLRKLGLTIPRITEEIQLDRDAETSLLQQIKRLNDYMALMTNEPSPPTEEDDTDAST